MQSADLLSRDSPGTSSFPGFLAQRPNVEVSTIIVPVKGSHSSFRRSSDGSRPVSSAKQANGREEKQPAKTLQPDRSSTLPMNDTAANKTPPPSSSPLPPERPSSALTCDIGGRERSRSDESTNQPPGMRDSFRLALSSSSNSFSAEVEHTRKERDLLLYKLKFIEEKLRRLEPFSGSDQPSSESETTAASVISSSHPSLPAPLHSPLPPHTQALSHSTPQLLPLSPPGASPPRHSFSMPSRYQAMPHTNSNSNRPMTSPVSQPIESSHSHPMSSASEGQSSANEPLSAGQDPVQCEPGAPSALEALTDDGRDGEGGGDSGSVHKENTELKTKVQHLEKSEANLRKTVEAKEEQMARLQSEVAALQEKLLRWEEESDVDRSVSGRGGSPSGGTSQSASKKGSGGGKSRHNRSLSVGRIARESKQPSVEEKKRKAKDQGGGAEEGRKGEEKKKRDERLVEGETKEVRQMVSDMKKRISSLETDNRDLKVKLEKRELNKQMKAKDLEIKQLNEEKEALRRKMELDRLGEEDGKDVEIQLSELLAENEDLKIKVMNLQKLLGKQSQFSPRYLHSSASHVAVTTDSNKVMARKSSGEEAVPPPHGTEGGGDGGEAEGGAKEAATMATDGVVLRQRMHAHRQSFRQSIIEKETQFRRRREQSSIRTKMQQADGTNSTGSVAMDASPKVVMRERTQSMDRRMSSRRSSMDSDHRLSLSVFFAELGLNLDNLAEVQEKVLQLQDSIIARDEILEEATAELNDLREKALNNTKYVTELKSRIIDLEGHQAVKDSQLRRVQSELEWKSAELSRLKDQDLSLPPSSLSSAVLSSTSAAEADGEDRDQFHASSQATLVPSKSPSQTPVSSGSEVGNLRPLVSELLFKLSQLQHFTDTLQREKNALQKSALDNERLHKAAMDEFVKDIQLLRRDNFNLAEQRVKLEEVPEMLEHILTMQSPLQRVEQAEELQQQLNSVTLEMREKAARMSELEWQVISRDTTIRVLQADRERQGASALPSSVGGGANGSHDDHRATMLSPPASRIGGDTRPQSAGSSQKPNYVLGHRLRSNSACRTILPRGDDFSISMPSQTPGCENEQVDLQQEEDASLGKITLGPSVTMGGGHVGPHLPFQPLHKREEEITEDPRTLLQQMRKHSHRRGASMDSFLAPHRDPYEGIQGGCYGTMGHRPLETLPSEEGSQSEHTTQLSVDGEDEGNGPVVEWDRERERGRGEDSQRPKSADSLMQFKELEGLVEDFISEKLSSHQVLPAIQPLSAGPAHNPSPRLTHVSSPQLKLKRGEHVDKRKYKTLPRPIPRPPAAGEGLPGGWSSTRLLPGQKHERGKQTRDKTVGPAPHHPAGSRPAARLTFHSPLPTAKEGGRKESASSVESVLTSPRGSDNYDTMVERNASFASHGGESSPNSNYSEFPLSGSQAFPFSINYPNTHFRTISTPSISSDDEFEHEKASSLRYQSRSMEDLDSSKHHPVRRSFRKEFPGNFPTFTAVTAYHKQTPSSDSDPYQKQAKPPVPIQKAPLKPSISKLNPQDIEGELTSLFDSEDDDRVQKLRSKGTVRRSASTGSVVIIYPSGSSFEDLKSLQ